MLGGVLVMNNLYVCAKIWVGDRFGLSSGDTDLFDYILYSPCRFILRVLFRHVVGSVPIVDAGIAVPTVYAYNTQILPGDVSEFFLVEREQELTPWSSLLFPSPYVNQYTELRTKVAAKNQTDQPCYKLSGFELVCIDFDILDHMIGHMIKVKQFVKSNQLIN